MKDISLWFVYKHYTECFVHIKKCTSHKLDSKLNTNDVLVLHNLDYILREISYVSAVFTGFLTTTAVGLFVSLNINSELHKNWIVMKGIIGAGILWKIYDIMDTGSHLGLMLAMPNSFKVLDEGLTEESIIRKYNLEFFEEFKEELEEN